MVNQGFCWLPAYFLDLCHGEGLLAYTSTMIRGLVRSRFPVLLSFGMGSFSTL